MCFSKQHKNNPNLFNTIIFECFVEPGYNDRFGVVGNEYLPHLRRNGWREECRVVVLKTKRY